MILSTRSDYEYRSELFQHQHDSRSNITVIPYNRCMSHFYAPDKIVIIKKNDKLEVSFFILKYM